MKFAFNLEWDELPSNFRDRKIWEVIDYWKNEEGGIRTNEELYKDAEEFIKAHFPVYF